MESPPSSRLGFYNNFGVLPGPIEGSTCGIAIGVPPEFHAFISLKLSGHPLLVQSINGVAFAEWPACGPGEYELLLECGEIVEHRSLIVVPRFFSEADFASIIQDLRETLPHAIATQLAACGAQLGTLPPRGGGPSLADEFEKLRSAISGTREKLGMLQVLAMLQRNCHQILLPKLELQRVDRARRPDISRLPQAIAIPGNLVSNTKLYQMYDVVVESSYEAYENRLVKAYVVALRSRISRLQAKLVSLGAPPAMANELYALSNEFQLAITRSTFLRAVRSSTITSTRVNMVLLKKPAYRAVLEGYLALREEPTVTLEDEALSSPLVYFPYLYQRWINLKVLNALAKVCLEAGYQCVNHHWIHTYQQSIVLQPKYDHQPAVQFRSMTSGQLISFVPWSATGEVSDIPLGAAIFVENQGKPASVLLFDPKYWTDPESAEVQPLKKDVDEILRVREHSKASKGTSEIRYSAILFPGKTMRLNPQIKAIRAHPADANRLQKDVCDVLKRYIQ